MKTFFSRLLSRKPKVKPTTHTIRLNGATAGILSGNDDNTKLTLCVFRSGAPWKIDDFLILQSTSGQTSRYRVTRVSTPRDPGDQHFIDCTFAPRP